MLKNLQVKSFLSRLADGDYALVESTMPAYPTLDPRTATVVAKTAAYTVTLADLEKPTIFTNTGATGNVALTLPTALSAKGMVIRVSVLAAQTVQLKPQAIDAVNYNGSAVVNKYAQIAGVIGNMVEAVSDGVSWIITRANGVLTKEA